MHYHYKWDLRRAALVVITALTLLWAAPVASDANPSDPNTPSQVEFSAAEVSRILQQSPLPEVPHDPSNAVDTSEAAAHLGQFLFFDRRLSRGGTVSCSTCHRPDRNWTDGKQLSEGVGVGLRRTPSLWNVAFNRWYFWDGRADSLWSQALKPMEARTEMNGSRVQVAYLISGDPDLRLAYTRIFGQPPEMPLLEKIRRSARLVLQDPTDPDQVAWSEISRADQGASSPPFRTSYITIRRSTKLCRRTTIRSRFCFPSTLLNKRLRTWSSFSEPLPVNPWMKGFFASRHPLSFPSPPPSSGISRQGSQILKDL